MITGWLLLQIGGGLLVYEGMRFVVVRRVRKAMSASATRFVRRHRIRLESARFIDRVWIREALAQDPRIETAIAKAASTGERSVRELRARVDAYVEEIAPFFSLAAYYRLGPLLAKRVVDFCFELVVPTGGFAAQLKKVPPEAVRVYVINHRANMDPLVLAYGLLRHVPMSYAVGEWALVWPLHTLFRAFGSYFVRRGEKDPLYHAVLERFIQMLAGHGAVTGFFPEGGLSRDGSLRKPRTGLLGYIIGLRHDHPDGEIAFMPVGLNYDRVLEDRTLLSDPGTGKPKRRTLTKRLWSVATGIIWVPRLVGANLLRVATRSHRKFGYAALAFGEPLLLSQWPGGPGIHLLKGAEQEEALNALGEELLNRRIGRVVPATPVPIFARAYLQEGPLHDAAVRGRVCKVLAALRERGAVLALGRAFEEIERKRAAEASSIHEAFDKALVDDEEADQVASLAGTLLLRRNLLCRVVTEQGPGLAPSAPDTRQVLEYYANSIQHHFGDRREPSPATAENDDELRSAEDWESEGGLG